MPTQRTVTVGPSGGGYDYTSLDAALVGESKGLVALDRQLDIVCHAMLEARTKVLTIGTDWITDNARFLRIRAADNHGGRWSENSYRIRHTAGATNALHIIARHVRLEGLQIEMANGHHAINLDRTGTNATAADTDVHVTRCILRGNPASTATATGVKLGSRAGSVRVDSTLIYDMGAGNTSDPVQTGINALGSEIALWVYNTTIVGGWSGVNRSSGTAILKNVITQDQSSAGFSGTSYSPLSSHNAANVVSGGTPVPGSDPIVGTVEFVDRAGKDYHLADTDTVARGTGINLSADPDYPIALDIDGEPISGAWSRGADQPSAPPPISLTATILAPPHGSTHPASVPLTLRGAATDVEGAEVEGATYVWTSNRDGPLGSGKVHAAMLSMGNHLITLTATTPGGKTATDAIVVTVAAEVAVVVPLAFVEESEAQAFKWPP